MTAADHLKSMSPQFEGCYLEGRSKAEKRKLRGIYWQLDKATRQKVEQKIAWPEILTDPKWEEEYSRRDPAQIYKIIVEPRWRASSIDLTEYGLGKKLQTLEYGLEYIVGVKECSPRTAFNSIKRVNSRDQISGIVTEFKDKYDVPSGEVYGI